MTFNQPAPRQRTAIACRYCRRRKIRCSGFDSAEDGRCTNCQRFTQECIFTPVSSQAQAFVPAHTAYPHLRNPAVPTRARPPMYPQNAPVIYGAHGQPLNPGTQQGHYPPEPGYPAGGAYAAHYPEDERHHHQARREHDDPHTPTLPPPLPMANGAPSLQVPSRRGSSGDYSRYPDQQAHHFAPHSPASSTHSYQSAYPPGPSQGGVPPAQPAHSTSHPPQYYSDSQRSPPQLATAYHFDRGSHSPHGSASTTSESYSFPAAHPPPAASTQPKDAAQVTPASSAKDSPSSKSLGGGERKGMSIQNMLDGGPGSSAGRHARDEEMLDALMPRKRKQ
ncbi:MAG: hypothetical protein M1825_002386 [Sarcosagium campestre]|nr:MAG: hypothetical protein M1825_002386 [Sarcosagium campestre]